MERLIVHPRVMREYPQLAEEDVVEAWRNASYAALRPGSQNFPEYVWTGIGGHGREVEMVGALTDKGWLVHHANTPVSKSIKDEIRRNERGR